jgi:pilus assembly protein TadC
MLTLLFLFTYLSFFSFVIGFMPVQWEERPTLSALGLMPTEQKRKQNIMAIFRRLAIINKPLCTGGLRRRIARDLSISHLNMTPEEFFLMKEACIALALFISFPLVKPDMIMGWFAVSTVFGYMFPEMWLKGRISKVKACIIRELPDSIDLLALCVNAGLDFMLALKWVVEKSPRSIMVDELNTVLQEINVGKTRREAIKDLAARYELPDLSTFARTLIQADKMGTSVTEALNILSEDMRLARYRRGEQLAMKAPLKMLVPLLLFIFPVVGILVAGPIMLDFIENNPFAGIGGGKK